MLQAMMRRFTTFNYDLCVIGGGPGGYVSAIRGAQHNLKTLCIDANPNLGGTCLNVGCIPSKILLNISHKYSEAKESFKQYGLDSPSISYDLTKIMEKKNSIIDTLTKGIKVLFKKNQVEYIKGFATFVNKNTVLVNNKEITSKNFIIATGSKSINLPNHILPIDQRRIINSTGALSLNFVPKKLLVIGGGVIGLELGSVFNRLGAQVDVVEYLDKILPSFDDIVSTTMKRLLQRQGFNFFLGQKVVNGEYINPSQIKVEIEDKKNPKNKQTLMCDCVLVATGRGPASKGIGLENLNVKLDRAGKILVNEDYQTHEKNIYAIGDVIPGVMLAHKAEEDGIKAVDVILGREIPKAAHNIPSVIYTNPEVASIGLNEEELKKKSVNYAVGIAPFIANSRARAYGEMNGLIKVLADRQTNKILGATIIGPHASEIVHEFVIAMKLGATGKVLSEASYGHPTFSESIKDACLATFWKPINI